MANPNYVVFMTSVLQDKTHRYLADELKKRGISGIEPSHGIILRQLKLKGTLSMSALTTLTNRTKPTVTVLVEKLIKHGYVLKTRDIKDQRVFLISPTEKALALANNLEEIAGSMRERLFADFNDEEKQAMADLLERAIANFDSK